MKMGKQNVLKIAALIFCISMIGSLFIVGIFSSNIENTYENTAYMEADGTFDRIELVARYYTEKVEVEGESLGVLTQSGKTNISSEHRKILQITPFGTHYHGERNFCFFLYVYNNLNHTRDRISIVGGTIEDYIYPNITIFIGLTYNTIEPNHSIFWGEYLFISVVGFIIIFTMERGINYSVKPKEYDEIEPSVYT
jgi:hypothetical protein